MTTSACKMHEEWSSVVQMHYTDFLLQLLQSADRKNSAFGSCLFSPQEVSFLRRFVLTCKITSKEK
jgi:hypothetical protein